MDTADSLIVLYKIMDKVDGPEEARDVVSSLVARAIYDLQREELPVNAENLKARIDKYVHEFEEVDRNEVA